MGLFSSRRGKRATRRAEAKALRVKAKAEAKLAARNEQKQFASLLKAEQKAARRTEKKTSRAEKKAYREAAAAREHERALADAAARKAEAGRINKATVTRAIGVGRVLLPVALPIAIQGATALRGLLDQRRAAKLGVPVSQLGSFSGHGARLTARIAHIEGELDQLVAQRPKDAATASFSASTRARLAELGTAVEAAEQLPRVQRQGAHDSIVTELDRIDGEILVRLGVRA